MQSELGFETRITQNLIQLLLEKEEGRGKVLKVTSSDRIKIHYWISVGVSAQMVLSAYATAISQRQKQNDPAPISIGYLDSILASLIKSNANSETSALITGAPAPWYVTDAGIENEANRMGVRQHHDETFPQFKARILVYRQVPADQYERDRKAFSNP